MDEPHLPTRRPLRFRPVDGLVLAAILTLLAAVLWPGILRLREWANRRTCSDNLRQIVIATHNYHGDYLKIPPGCWAQLPADAPFSFDFQNIGMLPALLPYLEHEDLFWAMEPTAKRFTIPPKDRDQQTSPPPVPARFDFGLRSASAGWYTSATNVALARTRLARFRCPSDRVDDDVTTGVLVVVTTAGDSLYGGYWPGPAGNLLGRTNYAPVSGCFPGMPYYNQWDGWGRNRSELSYADWGSWRWDGLSNTLFLGESLGGSTVTGRRDFAFAWMAGIALPAYWGLGPATLTPEEGGAAWYRFSSRHPRVVQFAFGDGSVRGLRFEPQTSRPEDLHSEAWYTLMEVVGRRDGGKRDTSVLLED